MSRYVDDIVIIVIKVLYLENGVCRVISNVVCMKQFTYEMEKVSNDLQHQMVVESPCVRGESKKTTRSVSSSSSQNIN